MELENPTLTELWKIVFILHINIAQVGKRDYLHIPMVELYITSCASFINMDQR